MKISKDRLPKTFIPYSIYVETEEEHLQLMDDIQKANIYADTIDRAGGSFHMYRKRERSLFSILLCLMKKENI